MLNTDEILGNVVWLIDALDDEVLNEVHDIPFLEMAKAVRIARQPMRNVLPVCGQHQRMQVCYPTRVLRPTRQ